LDTERVLLILLTLAMSGRALSYVFTYGAGRWTSEREGQEQALEQRLTALERSVEFRFDQASKEMSKWASYCQGLQDRCRQEFIPREALQAELTAAREERKALWKEIERLRNVGT